jgi:hypothetical protein
VQPRLEGSGAAQPGQRVPDADEDLDHGVCGILCVSQCHQGRSFDPRPIAAEERAEGVVVAPSDLTK